MAGVSGLLLMTNMTYKENIENLERCPSFNKCSQNQCPLDYYLSERQGGGNCKYLREPKKIKIKDKEFISGGSVMPDKLLKYVSKENISRLNEASKERWKIILDIEQNRVLDSL